MIAEQHGSVVNEVISALLVQYHRMGELQSKRAAAILKNRVDQFAGDAAFDSALEHISKQKNQSTSIDKTR